MSFAHYLLQVNLYLIVFYVVYKLLLDKETYFTLNRLYLMAAGMLSLAIPFIRLEWLTTHKAAQSVYSSVNWNAVLEKATVIGETQSGFNWVNLLVYIYCAGILFFLSRLIFNLFAVNKLIKTTKTGAAFSFFGSKIVDSKLPQHDVIDLHEEIHIKQLHTVDILFFELIGIITWLNPVIYLYKKTIKNIHEFLADEQAAAFQGDKAEYAMLILSKAFGMSPNSLTNGFIEKSLIKKRIYMLQKERSKRTAILKYGIFIPLFGLLIVFSSATIRKNENLISIAEAIPLEKPINFVKDIAANSTAKEIPLTSKAVVNDNHKSNWENFYKYLSKSIKYPESAYKNEIQGNTQVKFTIENGQLVNLSTNVKLEASCDQEAKNAVSNYGGFKNTPDGKYTMNVRFKIPDVNEQVQARKSTNLKDYKSLSPLIVTAYKAPSKTEDKTPDQVYDFVSIEAQPEFKGGIKKFYEYLSKSIKYPEEAQQNNVQGKVFLSFTVEKDGSLSDLNITRGLGSGTDEEAIRVLRESPKWNPGIQNGRPVRVKYNINVNFTLNEDWGPAVEKQTSSISSDPKQGKVLYKGFNTSDSKKAPLVILDGITQPSYAINYLKPDDIEAISVLKGESAWSLYGAKGNNGVILITSKKDKKADLFLKTETK